MFGPQIRRATAALWLVGAVISGVTAALAASHVGWLHALVFALAAVALVVLAAGTMRGAYGRRFSSAACCSARSCSARWDPPESLCTGVDGSKAKELHDLGVDPTLGVVLNLLYSLAAFVVFLSALRQAGRRTPWAPKAP
jgi:hypothetical protein